MRASDFEMRGPAVQFDYENQAWVENGVYIRCGHPENTNCQCYGRIHEGEQSRIKPVHINTGNYL